jgi:hypothetical protein
MILASRFEVYVVRGVRFVRCSLNVMMTYGGMLGSFVLGASAEVAPKYINKSIEGSVRAFMLRIFCIRALSLKQFSSGPCASKCSEIVILARFDFNPSECCVEFVLFARCEDGGQNRCT